MKLNVPEREGPAFRLDGVPIYPGEYRIPQDLSQEDAQRIADQGAGEFVADEPVKPSKAKKDDADHLA